MLLRRFTVSEKSMSPLFQEGDYVVTVEKPPKRGDVIVFEHPARPGFHLIKRVIGCGGQTVEVRNGAVSVDGMESAEPWTADDTAPDGSWQVRDEQVFVLGDARHRSSDDSRTIGPVDVGERTHVVVFRYWPARRAGRIKRP